MERTRWGLVALLFVMGMFAAAQFGKVSLTLNEHAAVFDRSPTGVALFVSLVGLVGLFCGAAAGAIVAWLSPRTSLLIGLVLSAAVSLAQSFLPPAEVYAALRLLEGVPHLTLVVAAPPIMAMIATDRDRPVVMSIWAMFFGLSFALSALIVPTLLEWGGLPLVLRAHGIGFLILLVLLWGQLPRTGRAALSLNIIRLHRDIYTSLPIVAPGAGFVFYTVTYIALLTYLPLALERPELFVRLPLVSLCSTLLAGYVCRSVAPDRVAVVGFLGGAVASIGIGIGLPLSPDLAFFFLGLVPGASFAAIPFFNAGLADRTRSTGAIAQLGNLGTVSGTPIFAGLLAGFGLPGILLGLAGFCLAGAGVLLLIGRSLGDHKR